MIAHIQTHLLKMTYVIKLFVLGACLATLTYTPLSSAGMPPMIDTEYAEFEKFMQELEKPEMQQFIKDFEKEFNSLPPEVQQQLNKQAEDDLKRLGIDPHTYQPIAPPAPAAQPLPNKIPSTPAPQNIEELASDCSQVTCHSTQQASSLLQSTISDLEVTRHKLALINLDTTDIQEWLNALTYYLKMINKPEHIKRLVSVTFTHLFDLITELSTLLRNESTSLIILAGEDESHSDDPYAILGIPYDISDEELKTVYDQKMAETDPAALKAELEQAQVDPVKTKKRVRQATLRQATLTDAYERLHEANLRQQIDRYRSHAQDQQLSLREANTQSIERLYDTLNNLVQQGIIQELEDFFARYAPTELIYHQHMEEAEKSRFAEQRSNTATAPVPSPLGGGYPFGGYQPQNYYPENNYFPQSYQPSFTPPGGGGGGAQATPGGSNGAPAKSVDKKPNKEESKDKDKAKDTKKERADAPKKDESKKKKKDDSINQIKKEFTKQLDSLKTPLKNFKDYIEDDAQEEVRNNLKQFAQPQTRGMKSITDNSFKALHKGLTKYVNPEFINKLSSIVKFVSEILINNKPALDACRPIWETHYKAHQKAYETFNTLYKHVSIALKGNQELAQTIPWTNVINACVVVADLQEIFKKPVDPKDKASQKKDSATPKTERPKKEREEKIKEQEEENPALPTTPEEALTAVARLKALYDTTENYLKKSPEHKTLLENTQAALKTKVLETVIAASETWNEYLNKHGLSEMITLMEATSAIIKKLAKPEQAMVKAAVKKLINAELYPLSFKARNISLKLTKFLYPAPKEPKRKPETSHVKLTTPRTADSGADIQHTAEDRSISDTEDRRKN